jgi:hypothetical protein
MLVELFAGIVPGNTPRCPHESGLVAVSYALVESNCALLHSGSILCPRLESGSGRQIRIQGLAANCRRLSSEGGVELSLVGLSEGGSMVDWYVCPSKKQKIHFCMFSGLANLLARVGILLEAPIT